MKFSPYSFWNRFKISFPKFAYHLATITGKSFKFILEGVQVIITYITNIHTENNYL